jgi:hypothetical protein
MRLISKADLYAKTDRELDAHAVVQDIRYVRRRKRRWPIVGT